MPIYHLRSNQLKRAMMYVVSANNRGNIRLFAM